MTFLEFAVYFRINHSDRVFQFWAGPEPANKALRMVTVARDRAWLSGTGAPLPAHYCIWGIQLLSRDMRFQSNVCFINAAELDQEYRVKLLKNVYDFILDDLEKTMTWDAAQPTMKMQIKPIPSTGPDDRNSFTPPPPQSPVPHSP